jgi:hypothetical protein
LNKVINPEKEQPEWKTLSALMKEINSRSPRDVMCVAGAADLIAVLRLALASLLAHLRLDAKEKRTHHTRPISRSTHIHIEHYLFAYACLCLWCDAQTRAGNAHGPLAVINVRIIKRKINVAVLFHF